MIRDGEQYLHHNFVVAVLNDLFGIQARGGCSCAGPYGHRLLGIDLTTSHAFEQEVLRGCEGIKPGWTRLNFNYFISEETFDFLIKAVQIVATEGWKLLPQYKFDPMTGQWKHRDAKAKVRMRLHNLRYRNGHLSYPARHMTAPEWVLPDYIEEAKQLLAEIHCVDPDTVQQVETTERFNGLRWFVLPKEVCSRLKVTQTAK